MKNDNINPKGLRVIGTARTDKEINEGAKKGFRPLVKPVTPSPQIKSKYAILQEKKTGAIEVINDYRARWNTPEMELVIDFTFYYPYHFTSPFAAYLIPADLLEGERVWIEDLIEDIVGMKWNQGDSYRLDSAEAVWDGVALLIDFNEPESAGIVG